MLSWKEYVETDILRFRDAKIPFLNPFIKENEEAYLASLKKPCQAVVIDFSGSHPVYIIVLHDENRPDMEITTYENVPFDQFTDNASKDVRLSELIDSKEIKHIIGYMKAQIPGDVVWDFAFQKFEKSFMFCFRWDPRSSLHPFEHLWYNAIEYIHDLYVEVSTKREKEKIEEAVVDVKRVAESITEIDLRTEVVEKLDKLENQINESSQKYAKLQDDLTKVRRLIGTETFGEWKVLLSEIDKMNTRIDALSDIRSAYDRVLAQQNQFMKQQSEVMKQQSSFIKWIKYATILLPIAVISVPVIEIISIVIRHSLGIP